jgi:hypothetical protein
MAVILDIVELEFNVPINCQVRAVSRESDCLMMTDDLKLGITFELVSTLLGRFPSYKGFLIADYCAPSFVF